MLAAQCVLEQSVGRCHGGEVIVAQIFHPYSVHENHNQAGRLHRAAGARLPWRHPRQPLAAKHARAAVPERDGEVRGVYY